MNTRKPKFTERIGKGLGDVTLYTTLILAVTLVAVTCIGCFANAIEGFVDLAKGIV